MSATKKIGPPPRLIRDIWEPIERRVCHDPEHEPPRHQVFEPGMYRHKCPSCGRVIEFVVVGPVW